MAGGRPSKYTPTIQKKAEKYLTQCGNKFWDYHKTQGEKSDTYERKVKIELPSIEGLAIYLGVAESTVYLWGEKHPLFSETLADIKQLQKKMLIEHSLNGDYSPMIAKLILSANHGMSEKTETDITTKGESLNEGVMKAIGKTYGSE